MPSHTSRISRDSPIIGTRIGESFRLRWDPVDLDQGIITGFATKTGKTRKVPANEGTERIQQYWTSGRRSENVFCSHETGEPPRDLRAGFMQASKKAVISGETRHTLRHTLASRLVNRGSNIVTVKELPGLSTVTVTMRYTHTHQDSGSEAVQNLEPQCGYSVKIAWKSR